MRSRQLQDAAAPEVTLVTTGDELQAALDQGAAHIEVREHLDLRTVEPIIVDPEYKLLGPFFGVIPFSVISIRVRLP